MTEKFIKLSDFLKMIGKEEEMEEQTAAERDSGAGEASASPPPGGNAPEETPPEPEKPVRRRKQRAAAEKAEDGREGSQPENRQGKDLPAGQVPDDDEREGPRNGGVIAG